MDQSIKDKLAKVYALVQHGGTDGEKQAARVLLEKMLKKYNLDGIDLDKLDKREMDFFYTTKMEQELLFILISKILTPRRLSKFSNARGYRISLTHLEYVELSCSYEYFRRHMKDQWNKLCLPEVKKKRKSKTRNARRTELQQSFSTRYFYLSGLLDDTQVKTVDIDSSDLKAIADAARLANVQGGKFNKQVQTAHQLPPASTTSNPQLSIF